MITITPKAAEQIRKASEQTNAGTMYLRIAARREDSGSLEYGMGFDDKKDEDLHLTSEGIDVVISNSIKELLMGAVLDYVEINPGDHQFIFKNPNDPAHALAPNSKGNGSADG
jgi:iron-sulfur cluster assembly protein